MRTKFVFESLRQEAERLRGENTFMKDLLYENLPPDVARKVILQCCSCPCPVIPEESSDHGDSPLSSTDTQKQFEKAAIDRDCLHSLMHTLDIIDEGVYSGVADGDSETY